MYFDTIQDLKNSFPGTNVPANTEFVVAGYHAQGDGDGGTFVWVPNSVNVLSPDDGIVFSPHSSCLDYGSGHFKRLYSGPINVRWFGAKGDGVTDDTAAVHAARDAYAFSNNGTLYFPIGVYLGAFVFEFVSKTTNNEFNLIGDGHGSVLKSNGTSGYNGLNNPVLLLGFRDWYWMWARVSNLRIDGSYQTPANRFSYGVTYGTTNPADTMAAGRWIFERVFFENCDRGVFKPTGNIGNHYIDCSWFGNTWGVYANGSESFQMHSGCDRYTGGHFTRSDEACIRYADDSITGGQIIIDGTVFEGNKKHAISIFFNGDGLMPQNSISLRNVWFENNGSQGGFDLYLEGVRSVRIEDGFIPTMQLKASSVSMFNCRHDDDFNYNHPTSRLVMDDKSSLVAYEHRYPTYPGNKIFVNSISYDATFERTNSYGVSSVWGHYGQYAHRSSI